MSARTTKRVEKLAVMKRARGLVLAAGLALVVASFASCAISENGGPAAERGGVAVPEAGTSDAAAVPDAALPSDAGCEPGDPDCTSDIIPCDEVEWCMVPTPLDVLHTFTAIWGNASNDVWAVGSGGTIMHFDGKTWVETPSGVLDTLYAIWGSGPNDIYAVSNTRTILHGTGFQGGSASWTRLPTGFTEWNAAFVRAVWGSSPDDVRLGGRAYDLAEPDWDNNIWAGHQLLKTTGDAGVEWKQVPGMSTVRSIWGTSATDVWMAADNSISAQHERGLLLHGTPRDGGAGEDPLAWTSIDSQSTLAFDAVWGSGPDDIWAVGALGSIRHYVPGNVRFDKVSSTTTEPLHAIWGSGPNDIWVVGDSGTILHYDGKAFRASTAQLPLGRRPHLYGVWGSSTNDVWIVGDGVALHYTGPKPKAGGRK